MPASAAEEALAALARDLVEEISAGRALELAGGTPPGMVTTQRRPPAQGTGLPGQQEWKDKGDGIWAAGRWHDIDQPSAEQFSRHVEAAHAHLSGPDSPSLSRGYAALHEAHRTAVEQLLPKAETPQQNASVSAGIAHLHDRMRDIDKAAGTGTARTARLTSDVPGRAARAAERLAEGPQHPAVQLPPPQLPPPPAGAQAVHPHLGGRLVTPLAGDTISRHAHAHMAHPVPRPAAAPQATALDKANGRLAQYAQREDAHRQSDLRDHLAELRQSEQAARDEQAAARGMAPEGRYAPLSDEQHAAHARSVQEAVHGALDAGQATSAVHSSDGGHSWHPQRALEHQSILQDYLAAQTGVPSGRRALVAGGLSGAGKSAVLRQSPDAGDYAAVSPGRFKEELARRGLVPEVPGLSPMEASPLVHDESAYLAGRAAELLAGRGKNIAWDGGAADEGSLSRQLSLLEQHGYATRGVFADTPVPLAADRSSRRHRQGLEAYRRGSDPLGARHVPADLIRSRETAPGTTSDRQAFEAHRHRFADWQVWDGSGPAPRLAGQSPPAAPHGIPSAEELLRGLHRPGGEPAP